ncbi:hypothetical protein BT93_D1988 [Corymbia citriodora subsp. variegata]|nr:hypothetical protein BT93_D1988 [Corymbia citriodora subsp. variegata]
MFSVHTILFHKDEIKTWVTNEPTIVSRWIRKVEHLHRRKLRRLIVGLDTEWRPSSKAGSDFHKVATLQLCVGHRCLIFQLLHARYIPESLFVFLANVNYTFVGVGVDEDARKLTKDYGLDVSCTIDIRGLASKRLRNDLWGYMGLKKLSKGILCKELEKPKEITLSRWDNKALTDRQIEYGCLDAFVSFELGRVLRASSVNRVFDGWRVRIDEDFLFNEKFSSFCDL